MSSHHGFRPSTDPFLNFNAFFEGWLARQQAFLDELTRISTLKYTRFLSDADNDEDGNGGNVVDELIQRTLHHYGEYYEEKARVTRADIFVAFCPPWLTSFEAAFLWVGGLFKPSLMFNLQEMSISNMVLDQLAKMSSLKSETLLGEKELTEALAAVQERVGSPEFMELARGVGSLVDGEASEFNEAMEELKHAMTRLVERADNLRRCTVLKVVDILNREQKVNFLIALAKYQLGLRAWGLQMDNQYQGEVNKQA